MKIKQVGQKLHNYGTRLGHKLYGGVKSLGHKVYDSRYKLLAGTSAAIGAGLLGAIGVGAQAIAQAPEAMNVVKSKFPKMGYMEARPYDIRTHSNPLYDYAVTSTKNPLFDT